MSSQRNRRAIAGLGEIIDVRPEFEALTLAVDSLADFQW
jgi:hypothetical protein